MGVAIRGVDLSHHNSGVDFEALKAAGVRFVALKASEGSGNQDGTFVDRWNAAADAEIEVLIAYHFFHPAEDTLGQARNFLDVYGTGMPDLDELIAIDVESTGGWGDVDRATAVERIIDLIAAIKTGTGAKDEQILIYLSLGWARAQLGSHLSRLTPWKLWAARYGPELGDPSPWGHASVWQNCEHGSVPGAGSGDVDTDVWLADWPLGA